MKLNALRCIRPIRKLEASAVGEELEGGIHLTRLTRVYPIDFFKSCLVLVLAQLHVASTCSLKLTAFNS